MSNTVTPWFPARSFTVIFIWLGRSRAYLDGEGAVRARCHRNSCGRDGRAGLGDPAEKDLA